MKPIAIQKSLKLGLVVTALSSMTGCLHQNSEARLAQIPWDELTIVTGTDFEPSPEVFIDDVILSEYKLARLPTSLRTDRDLARLVLSRGMQNPIVYNRGVLGRIGSAKMYVTTKERVGNRNALYGVIMRVLSEQYGCFLRGRVKSEDWYRFFCRDHRQIVLWPSAGEDYQQFYARQFDAEGYEIKVENRRIVRISDKKVL